MLNIDLEGLYQMLKKGLEAAEPGKIYTRALEYLGGRAVTYVKTLTPVNTGKLKRSWNYSTGSRSVRVKSSAEHAAAVNYGHRVTDDQGRTTGFVPGVWMLEQAAKTVARYDMDVARKMVLEDLKKEMRRK